MWLTCVGRGRVGGGGGGGGGGGATFGFGGGGKYSFVGWKFSKNFTKLNSIDLKVQNRQSQAWQLTRVGAGFGAIGRLNSSLKLGCGSG